MRRRISFTALIVLGLLALALSVPLWFTPLLRFLSSNSADVQNLTNVAQLLLFAGSFIALVVGAFRLVWQRKPEPAPAASAVAPEMTQQVVVNIGEFERLASSSAQSWASVSVPDSPNPQLAALPELRRLITERISKSELQNVCFDLRVDYDMLPGESHLDKVRELLTYLGKRNRVAELVQPLTTVNPSVNWNALLAPAAPTAPAEVSATRREQTETVRRYFEYLADEHKYLRFKGMGLRQMPLNVPLLEVYVPLFARRKAGEGEREAYGRRLRVAGRTLTDDERAALGEHAFNERVPILQLLQQNKGLIILGEPGSGKSTFVRYLAVCLALGQGNDPALNLGPRFPILLPLADYADELQARKVGLRQFLIDYYTKRLDGLPNVAEMMTDALATGKAIVLLDGLDEVKDPAHRSSVLQEAASFFNLHKQYGNQFVLTCRIIGYDAVRLAIDDVVECIVEDFDDDDIKSFVESWSRVIERTDQGGDTEAARRRAGEEEAGLKRAIFANSKVRDLASNPLMLTIMAVMKRQGVTLPELRVQLYAQCVEVMLKSWEEGRTLSAYARASQVNIEDLLKPLSALALWSQEVSPGANRMDAADARKELRRIYRELGSDDADADVNAFFETVHKTSNLLVERGADEYGFNHRTFLQYLAAVGIARRAQLDAGEAVRLLAPHVDEQDWHEVFVLTVPEIGVVRKNDEQASEVARRLLHCGQGTPGKAVALVGEAVVNALPGGVTLACKKEVVIALREAMEDVAHVPAVVRAEAGRALAKLGDNRPEVLTCDAMPLCLVPAGPFILGSTKEQDDMAYDDEIWGKSHTISYDYFIGQYPVTNAQFHEFVRAGGYSKEHERYWDEAKAAGVWRDGKVYRNVYYYEKGELKKRPESEQGEGATAPYDFGEPYHLDNHPVVGVTWYEALAFTRWLTDAWKEQLLADWVVTLPSEVEWEKAARGGEHISQTRELAKTTIARMTLMLANALPMMKNPNPARRYAYNDTPENNAPEPERMNFDQTGINATSAVGCFPNGASPYGCEDMNGNVWEWTISLWGKKPGDPDFIYPYDKGAERESLVAGPNMLRVLRGGFYFDGGGFVRCAFRGWDNPVSRDGSDGFRVAVRSHSS